MFLARVLGLRCYHARDRRRCVALPPGDDVALQNQEAPPRVGAGGASLGGNAPLGEARAH